MLTKVEQFDASNWTTLLATPVQYDYDADNNRVKKTEPGATGYDAATVYVGNYYEASNDVVWVDDSVPAGATLASNNESWAWSGSSPTPKSGNLTHPSALVAGWHQHYFNNATQTMPVGTGDKLYAWIYIDPTNPPTEVMLQWYESVGGWEHRAFWGADQIAAGTLGTASRYQACACLPASGRWLLIGVPAASVGLEGKTVTGMAFTLYGGKATWDKAGKFTPTLSNVTKYYYFGGQRVAMRNSSGVAWLHGDHLGSASAATNDNGGTLISDLRYTPYGSPRNPSGNMPTNRQFTGMPTNGGGIGLVSMGAREYDPLIGRFISADTIVPGAGNPQAFNRYSYTRNNPLSRVDPSGHADQCAFNEGCGGGPTMRQLIDNHDEGSLTDDEFRDAKVGYYSSNPNSNPMHDSSLGDLEKLEAVLAKEQYQQDAQKSSEQDWGTVILFGIVASAENGDGGDPLATANSSHLNTNSSIGHFGIYEIKIENEVYKYGKADMGRLTEASGLPTRLHQQVRKLQENSPGQQITGKIVEDLGVTTTAQAKQAETAHLQKYYNTTQKIPPGNKKTFRPQ